tara:strand:- start:615 stop:794 length:180 start_codon:yes stop_codon:yes gene_type:complete
MSYDYMKLCKDGTKSIVVPEEYLMLIEKEAHLLEMLTAHGVEDWIGYADAVAEYEEEMS